jgi:hypothetical protein
MPDARHVYLHISDVLGKKKRQQKLPPQTTEKTVADKG